MVDCDALPFVVIRVQGSRAHLPDIYVDLLRWHYKPLCDSLNICGVLLMSTNGTWSSGVIEDDPGVSDDYCTRLLSKVHQIVMYV